MCRYDDDYEWYVDDTNPTAVSEKDEKCEDCGRVIPVGEPHTVFTAMASEWELNPPPPEHHVSCNHCRAANIWLEKVCHQHTVLVTVVDLAEHWHDYTPEQLGADFEELYLLSRNLWRNSMGLVDPLLLERLARSAAEFALAGNLVHD